MTRARARIERVSVIWRRVDTGFERHPKVLLLIEKSGWKAFYFLSTLHSLASETDSKGLINKVSARHIGATTKYLTAMVEVGLLDINASGDYVIHDWAIYSGTTDEAVACLLHSKPKATANDCVRALGRNRAEVLAAVARHKANPGPTEPPTTGTTEPHKGGSNGTGSEVVPKVVPRSNLKELKTLSLSDRTNDAHDRANSEDDQSITKDFRLRLAAVIPELPSMP
jgi:hypothetical protein